MIEPLPGENKFRIWYWFNSSDQCDLLLLALIFFYQHKTDLPKRLRIPIFVGLCKNSQLGCRVWRCRRGYAWETNERHCGSPRWTLVADTINKGVFALVKLQCSLFLRLFGSIVVSLTAIFEFISQFLLFFLIYKQFCLELVVVLWYVHFQGSHFSWVVLK